MVSEVFVKFLEMPIYDKIRELRYVHIGKLINVKGVVTVRGESLSQMVKVIYKCIRCGETKGPFYIHNRSGSNLGSCRSCQSSAFAMEKSRCLYQNYQRITVQ
jgi:DNA replicative helicase MCM subunit Mcm2 (Cdc46/Mcm family)